MQSVLHEGTSGFLCDRFGLFPVQQFYLCYMPCPHDSRGMTTPHSPFYCQNALTEPERIYNDHRDGNTLKKRWQECT